MSYDEKLAGRLRERLALRAGMSERRMFGGLCFLLHGNMLCGVVGEHLMFRVGKEKDQEALARPGARPMDFTGKAMAGFVFVDPTACPDPIHLDGWVDLAADHVAGLPEKTAPAKRTQEAKPGGNRPGGKTRKTTARSKPEPKAEPKAETTAGRLSVKRAADC